ncbi:hypothetical protein G9A89_009787 [Geosiphon pyriformis]|nr:hypothetical protein G9A89_009787 [Geosiphon pyriformis]
MMLPGDPVDCFLAGITNTLSSCGLSLGSSVTNVFHASSEVAAANVFGLDIYMKVSGGLVGSSNLSYLPFSKFFSYNTGYVKDHLRRMGSDVIPVYTDSSVRDFGFFGASGSAAAYFPSADIGVKGHAGVIGNKHADFFASAAGSSFIFPVKMLHHFLSIKDRILFGNTCYVVRRLYEAVNLVGWESRYASGIVNKSLSGLIDKHHTFNVWYADGLVKSGYTSFASVMLLDVRATCDVVVCSLYEATDLNSLYMSLSKGFVFKDWVAETKWFLKIESNSGSLMVDLVCRFAENYRSSIWLPRAKLRAHYKKHGLLPRDRSIVLLVTGLFLVWSCDIVHNFGIKLGIHTCFGFHPYLNSVQFGFLCDFLMAGILGV